MNDYKKEPESRIWVEEVDIRAPEIRKSISCTAKDAFTVFNLFKKVRKEIGLK